MPYYAQKTDAWCDCRSKEANALQKNKMFFLRRCFLVKILRRIFAALQGMAASTKIFFSRLGSGWIIKFNQNVGRAPKR
ncbi:MAG: hypothetical protein ACK4NS_01225 [Saprospiraceae bacterium]